MQGYNDQSHHYPTSAGHSNAAPTYQQGSYRPGQPPAYQQGNQYQNAPSGGGHPHYQMDNSHLKLTVPPGVFNPTPSAPVTAAPHIPGHDHGGRKQKFTWETRKVMIPRTIHVKQTVYETKMVAIQVPKTVVETVVIEVPFRDVKVPVRQLTEKRTMVVQKPREIVENFSYEVEEDVYEDTPAPYQNPKAHQQPKSITAERIGFGLGLEVDHERDDEIYIYEIVPGFAAERNGSLRVNDVLVSIDGKSVRGFPLPHVRDLTVDMEGTTSRVVVRRGTQEVTAVLTRVIPRSLDTYQESVASIIANSPGAQRRAPSLVHHNPGGQPGGAHNPLLVY